MDDVRLELTQDLAELPPREWVGRCQGHLSAAKGSETYVIGEDGQIRLLRGTRQQLRLMPASAQAVAQGQCGDFRPAVRAAEVAEKQDLHFKFGRIRDWPCAAARMRLIPYSLAAHPAVCVIMS